MSVNTYRVLIGACGWKHQAWNSDFYSDGLPEDWQLGFYANEFSVVYVPAADWLAGSGIVKPDLLEWTEDVSDSFRFILEISEPVLDDKALFDSALNKARALGKFCLGLVIQLSPALNGNPTLLHQRLEMAQAITPVCIDTFGMTLTDKSKDLLTEQNIAEVWHGEAQGSESLNQAVLAVTHISGDGLNMPELRKILEVCLSQSNENSISVLCIDGEPPSLEILRNADVILNLL